MPLTSSLTLRRGRPRAGRGRTRSSSRSGSRSGALRRHVDAPCASGSPCPWPGRPRRRARSRCSPRARPGCVYFMPLNSLPLKSTDLNVGGRARRAGSGRRPWRGWRRAGRPSRTCCTGCRWSGPRPGSRWRCCASPTAPCRSGQVPSTGKALTGSWSPLLASMTRGHVLARTRAPRRTRSAASCGVAGRPRPGTLTSCRLRQRLVDGREVLLHDLLALLP